MPSACLVEGIADHGSRKHDCIHSCTTGQHRTSGTTGSNSIRLDLPRTLSGATHQLFFELDSPPPEEDSGIVRRSARSAKPFQIVAQHRMKSHSTRPGRDLRASVCRIFRELVWPVLDSLAGFERMPESLRRLVDSEPHSRFLQQVGSLFAGSDLTVKGEKHSYCAQQGRLDCPRAVLLQPLATQRYSVRLGISSKAWQEPRVYPARKCPPLASTNPVLRPASPTTRRAGREATFLRMSAQIAQVYSSPHARQADLVRDRSGPASLAE